MILINPQVIKPEDHRPTAEIFPHLFTKQKDFSWYKQTSKFYFEFDAENNLIIETLEEDKNEITSEVLSFLTKHKQILLNTINTYKERLNTLKEFYTPENQTTNKEARSKIKSINQSLNHFKKQLTAVNKILA